MDDRPDAETEGSRSVPLSRRSRRVERQQREARREAARGPVARAMRRVPVVPIVVGVLIACAAAALILRLLPTGEEEFAGERNPHPGADGVILADAPPSHWEIGDCLQDVDPGSEDAGATVVECDQEHNAQVLHTETLDDDGAYPGDDVVLSRTQAACQEVDRVDQDAVDDSEHALEVRMSHPTQSSWGDGDRRVTCTVERSDGGDLTGSFVLSEEEAAAEEDAEDQGDDAADPTENSAENSADDGDEESEDDS